jgi:signal transduction histidine kinase
MGGGVAGLTGRLLLAHALVVAVGGGTVLLVAAVAGPPLFREHLGHVDGVPPAVSGHVEQAYVSAGGLSLGLALLAALAAAIGASTFAAGRLARPVAALVDGAAHVAGGHYTVRVPAPGIGNEFDRLAESFNQMAGRLAAVEASRHRMLADLAHELRTPLATIEAYLDAIADGVEVAGEDPAEVLRTQTARLRRLTDDLGAVSRAEEPPTNRRPVAPAALVAAAVAAARSRYAAKGVRLYEQCVSGLPLVSTDPDRIGQVLANLLDNALRHTPPGGRVSLTAQVRDRAVQVAVSDTGDGIPTDQLPHVFERFYRTDPGRDRKHGGSGIGLAIVRGVVTAHGGRVEAASPGPGGGATFTVTLPVAGR